MMSSITRVFDADRNQLTILRVCLFGANGSHECRTSDNESKWAIFDGLQLGPLGAARQRPKGCEVTG
jgi:hypothetical protein